MRRTTSNGTVQLDDDQRLQLEVLRHELGEATLVSRLHVNKQTFLRALSGLGVRTGSALLIEQQLEILLAERGGK